MKMFFQMPILVLCSTLNLFLFCFYLDLAVLSINADICSGPKGNCTSNLAIVSAVFFLLESYIYKYL